jgi:hypothetical protein
MKKLILLISILVNIQFVHAQITFQKTFGGIGADHGRSIQQTSDGGYIITGNTQNITGSNDYAYLIKLESTGDTVWTKTFGILGNNNCWGFAARQTLDGGYIISGESFGAACLIKTDLDGNIIWSKSFNTFYEGYSVKQTADSGYIFTGYFYNNLSFGQDIYLIKTDENGDILWSKSYGGNAQDDKAYSVLQTPDGGYAITGTTASFGAGNMDVFLIKTDSNGDILWARTFGGTGNDLSYSIEQTDDGGYIISGSTTSFGVGSIAVYLIKTDSNGNLIWTKSFVSANGVRSNSVQKTLDGGYIIAGSHYSLALGGYDVFLIKTDSSGNSLWTRTFGGINDDQGFSCQQTTDGGYIVVGYSQSFGAGGYDIYLIKTDSLGNSGCNQGSPTVLVNTTTTLVSNPLTSIFSPSSPIVNPTPIVGSGNITTNLCTTVGLSEIRVNDSFTLIPNPSTGAFIISFKNKIISGNIEIDNILGAQIFSQSIMGESEVKINLKNISGGIYFVNIFDGVKRSCKKLIFSHN